MPFIDAVIEDMQTLGDAALDTSSPFDEAAVFGEVHGRGVRDGARLNVLRVTRKQVMDMMSKELGLVKLTTTTLDDDAIAKFGERAADAVPLRPLFMFAKE